MAANNALRISTMNSTSVLGLAVFIWLVFYSDAAPAAPEDKYTTRYDYIDVDAILRSKRLLKGYMECVMDRGPCTREGLELRKNLPEAIQTECEKCSKRQKEWAGKILAYLLQNHRQYWDDLLKKYDPDKKFIKKFEFEEDDEGGK